MLSNTNMYRLNMQRKINQKETEKWSQRMEKILKNELSEKSSEKKCLQEETVKHVLLNKLTTPPPKQLIDLAT